MTSPPPPISARFLPLSSFLPLEQNILVSNYFGNAPDPTIAIDPNGNFAVAWVNQGSDADIYLNFFDSNGIKKTNALQVNLDTIGEQTNPDIAISANGNTIVTWLSDNAGKRQIYGKLYDSQGSVIKEEFSLTGIDASRQAAVATDANGNFAVAWLRTNPKDTRYSDVCVQRFNSQGTPQGEKIIVAPFGSSSDPDSIDIGMDADGDFVVAWKTDSVVSPNTEIYARRYNNQGIAQGGSLLVNDASTDGEQTAPQISMDANGSFLINWYSVSEASQYSRFYGSTDYGYPYTEFSSGDKVTSPMFGDTSPYSITLPESFVSTHANYAISSNGTIVELNTQTSNNSLQINRYVVPPSVGFSQSQYSVNEDGTPSNSAIIVTRSSGLGTTQVQIKLSSHAYFFEEYRTINQPINEGDPNEPQFAVHLPEIFYRSEFFYHPEIDYTDALRSFTLNGFPQTITFAPGETSKTILLPLVQDTIFEGNRRIWLELTPVSNARMGFYNDFYNSEAGVRIVEDDPRPPMIIHTFTEPIQVMGTALNDSLIGNWQNNIITGEAGNDSLIGGEGNDLLNGGAGSDILNGGNGADRFLFDVRVRFQRAILGIDQITDFTKGTDKIVLDRTAFKELKGKSFASVKTLKEARNSTSLITYVRSSGKLFYNENRAKAGFGQGGQFADLANEPALAKTDFSIIA